MLETSKALDTIIFNILSVKTLPLWTPFPCGKVLSRTCPILFIYFINKIESRDSPLRTSLLNKEVGCNNEQSAGNSSNNLDC